MTKRPFIIIGGILLSIYFLLSCSSGMKDYPANSKAQAMVDASIKQAGLDKLESAQVAFTFRDKNYKYKRQGSEFEYQRIFFDSTGQQIIDVLNNQGTVRMIEGERVDLSAKKASAYGNAVNSVFYFAFLPFRLNDPATIKQHIGEEVLAQNNYVKIKVTFQKEGGGKDYDDVFYYWFDKEDNSLDYLAYEYHTDGGGIRFRKAFNSRRVNGVQIQDYENYKPLKGKNVKLAEIGKSFENGDLELLSKIELEDVVISLL